MSMYFYLPFVPTIIVIHALDFYENSFFADFHRKEKSIQNDRDKIATRYIITRAFLVVT